MVGAGVANKGENDGWKESAGKGSGKGNNKARKVEEGMGDKKAKQSLFSRKNYNLLDIFNMILNAKVQLH